MWISNVMDTPDEFYDNYKNIKDSEKAKNIPYEYETYNIEQNTIYKIIMLDYFIYVSFQIFY